MCGPALRQAYKRLAPELYSGAMEVPVSDLRANLRHYIDEVRDGAELIVTERGLPVARILGVDATPAYERLIKEGVIGLPENRGRRHAARPTLRAKESISDIVIAQRERGD